MHSVTIDAGVLALPAHDCMPEDVHEYVSRLLEWQKVLSENLIGIFMSERITAVLLDDCLYPLRGELHKLFSTKGIVEYDANTVAAFTEQLLRLTPHFEARFGMREVLQEQLHTTPALHDLTVGSNVASDLGRCLTLFAILRSHCGNESRQHTVVLRKGPVFGPILIRTLIYELEHGRNDLAPLPEPPECFSGVVAGCTSFHGLIMGTDESEAWMSGEASEDRELAVRIAVYKSRVKAGQAVEWDELPLFRFGGEFLTHADSMCRDLRGTFIERLLRSIVETLEQAALTDTHQLRTNPAGGSPQRRRRSDSAKAWRRDIDHTYHLHYWQCQDGLIELASVVTHNDFRIPE